MLVPPHSVKYLGAETQGRCVRREEINFSSSDIGHRKYGPSARLCYTAQPDARVRNPRQQRHRRSTNSGPDAYLLSSTRRWIVCHSRTKTHLRDPKGQRHLCHSITGTGASLPYADNTAAVLHPGTLLGKVRIDCSCSKKVGNPIAERGYPNAIQGHRQANTSRWPSASKRCSHHCLSLPACSQAVKLIPPLVLPGM